jgi:hypothetical protein
LGKAGLNFMPEKKKRATNTKADHLSVEPIASLNAATHY